MAIFRRNSFKQPSFRLYMKKPSNPRVPSDTLIYSLAYLPPNTRFRVDEKSHNSPTVYLASFYQALSRKPKYSSLFEGWSFNEEGCPPPSCEVILQGIDRLVISNLLNWVGQEYIITKELSRKRDDIERIFSKKDGKLLREIAEEFRAYSKIKSS